MEIETDSSCSRPVRKLNVALLALSCARFSERGAKKYSQLYVYGYVQRASLFSFIFETCTDYGNEKSRVLCCKTVRNDLQKIQCKSGDRDEESVLKSSLFCFQSFVDN